MNDLFGLPFDVDPSRVRGVKNPLPVPTECPNCGASVTVENNKAVYRKSIGKWPWIYRCESTQCDSYIGMHPNTAIPLGTLANKPLRKLRVQFKQVFNPLWHNGARTRTEAYHWLANEMGIPASTCHGGWFDTAQCKAAIKVCRKELRRLNGVPTSHHLKDDNEYQENPPGDRVPDWFDERNKYLAPDDGGGTQSNAPKGSESAPR